MADNNSRFTLMAFPQNIDVLGNMHIRIVMLPRNINPLEKVNSIYNAAGAKPFADVNPELSIMLVKSPVEFPGKIASNEITIKPSFTHSSLKRPIFEILKNTTVLRDGLQVPKYFDIDENRSADKAASDEHRAPKPVRAELSLRKYLPLSYRQSFNFTGPRSKNAVTDDSYQCAVRDDTTDPTFQASGNKISWGKVIAYLMRQPYIAEKAGLIYDISVKINPADLENGGWVYCDILSGDYAAEQTASRASGNKPFIKCYAAKIPPLKVGEERPLFASLLFPVQKQGENPIGNFDQSFIESAKYLDGFAGLVHSYQPHSHHLLHEEADGFHPQKEIGIRLGWDDEQILEWFVRQMSIDDSVGGDEKLDVALGVNGYCVDFRTLGAANWENLNAVKSNGNMMLEHLNLGSFTGLLPFQVYPSKLSNAFWLPMYFCNWNDHSIVLPDKVAADLYQNQLLLKNPTSISDTYSSIPVQTKLAYGKQYEFRVRLYDLSGGYVPLASEPADSIPGYMAKTHFKRYVAPNALRFENDDEALKVNSDDVAEDIQSFDIKRPLLGYPAVLFTRKYEETTALQLLKNQRDENFVKQQAHQRVDGFGIADLDVTKVEIVVEVETLKMDNLVSETGKENYIKLYSTQRSFAANDPEHVLRITLLWKNYDVLNLGDTTEPFDNDADNDSLHKDSLILPTDRNLRITLRAVCDEDEDYWGTISTNTDLDSRYGKKTTIHLRKASHDSIQLFDGQNAPELFKGIFLQSDAPPPKLDAYHFKTLNGKAIISSTSKTVQRLADELKLETKGNTLIAPKGERVVFWCSNLIRHQLSPDNASITFNNSTELVGQWLICQTLYVNRDWTWDNLHNAAFSILRKRAFGSKEDLNLFEWINVGHVDLFKVASFEAIQEGADKKVHREFTRLVIIDALDGNAPSGNLPDVQQVSYQVHTLLKSGESQPFNSEVLTLPCVQAPDQTPKLIGSGIALSPYVRNKKYSETETRTRYLWLEFDKAPLDARDELFARVLAYAPDQLLSNNAPSLLEIPEESPLPIDSELIRVITPNTTQSHPGLDAMQLMQKSKEGDRHFYLLPLPPGLHHESPELFGFFTYEFRFGHSDKLWATAQARFGRQFRIPGLQHPAPALMPVINRDDKHLIVYGNYAKAVHKGKNVTSKPPRTSLWCMLYAQVMQADGLDYRNILLDNRIMTHVHDYKLEKEMQQKRIDFSKNRFEVQQQPASLAYALAREGNAKARVQWSNDEIADMLDKMGLPEDASLSVLCVEMFGQINNPYDHINDLHEKTTEMLEVMAQEFSPNLPQMIAREMLENKYNQSQPEKGHPLQDKLGYHRIVRTSHLLAVPFVCCTDCE